MTERRYSLHELAAAMGVTIGQAPSLLGIGGPEYVKYRDEGMPREVAERKALKAGLHPYEVFPEMADHDFEDAEAADRKRATDNARRYRRRHPEVQAKDRARRRAYYEQYSEYEKARERRRYAENAERLRAERRERYARNKEREAEYRRAYYLANAEQIKAKERERKARRRAEASRDRDVPQTFHTARPSDDGTNDQREEAA